MRAKATGKPDITTSVGKVFLFTMTEDLGADLVVVKGDTFTDADARRLNILIALTLKDTYGAAFALPQSHHLRPMRRTPE